MKDYDYLEYLIKEVRKKADTLDELQKQIDLALETNVCPNGWIFDSITKLSNELIEYAKEISKWY